MATTAEWVEGARLRTLPAALAPVLAGSATALFVGGFDLLLAVLAFVVAVSLQIGVNYSNDYSDGIRGTDSGERVGPQRLVGSGAASPVAVKHAAFACFALAAVVGLAVVSLSGHWWLLLVGAACIVAAWYYTGGPHPYGYAGLGELFVFVFFGLVAVGGTRYVMTGTLDAATLAAAVAVGSLSSAVLVANNLRDIGTDVVASKRTLATRLGERGTRQLYVGLCVVAVLAVVVTAVLTTAWALLGLVMVPVLVSPVRVMVSDQMGQPLVAALKATGIANVAGAAGLLAGCLIGA